MVWHFTIGPAGDYPTVVRQILAMAELDPLNVIIDKGKLGQAIVFCPNAELADWTRRQVSSQGALSPSLCILELEPHGIQVSQECADDSRERLEAFIKWILRNFGPCRIFDHDSDREWTDEVAKNPDVLFH